MKTSSDVLACFEVDKVAFGYSLFDTISKTTSVEILEALPISPTRFQLLFRTTSEGASQCTESIHAQVGGLGQATVVDHELISSPHPDLLETYFSLRQQSLLESLLVIQTESLSALLCSANFVLKFGKLKAIELKVHRGQNGLCLGFFTGATEDCVVAGEEIRTKLKASLRHGNVAVIEKPNAIFREFFNLDGQV